MGGSFILTYAMSLDDKNMKWIGICLQAIAQLLHLVERSNAANVQYNQRDMVTIMTQSLQ
jgi:hypothetical protein